MQKQPRALTVLDIITAAFMILAAGLVFLYAPEEAVMGQVQRVFYFHVSSAWLGMLGFIAAGVTSIIFLRTGDHKWDLVSLGAIEIGMIFSFITIVSGSIWARPIWNTWWTWDPRLTTATVMELIYIAYLMLRQGIEDPDRRARFGSVYAIIGVVSVPLTFFSIRIFRTIHPVVIGGFDPNATGNFDMTPKMLQTFIFSLLAFSIFFVDLLWHRIRLGKLADQVELLKMKLSQ